MSFESLMGFSLDAATSSGISRICCETALIGRLQFHDGVPGVGGLLLAFPAASQTTGACHFCRVHTDQTHMLHGAGPVEGRSGGLCGSKPLHQICSVHGRARRQGTSAGCGLAAEPGCESTLPSSRICRICYEFVMIIVSYVL